MIHRGRSSQVSRFGGAVSGAFRAASPGALRGCLARRPGPVRRAAGTRARGSADPGAPRHGPEFRGRRGRPWPAPGGPVVTRQRPPQEVARPHPGWQAAASLLPAPIARRCSPREAYPAARLPRAQAHAEPAPRWRASSARPCRACRRIRVPLRPVPTGRRPARGRRTPPGDSPPRRGERAAVWRPPRAGSAGPPVPGCPGPGTRRLGAGDLVTLALITRGLGAGQHRDRYRALAGTCGSDQDCGTPDGRGSRGPNISDQCDRTPAARSSAATAQTPMETYTICRLLARTPATSRPIATTTRRALVLITCALRRLCGSCCANREGNALGLSSRYRAG